MLYTTNWAVLHRRIRCCQLPKSWTGGRSLECDIFRTWVLNKIVVIKRSICFSSHSTSSIKLLDIRQWLRTFLDCLSLWKSRKWSIERSFLAFVKIKGFASWCQGKSWGISWPILWPKSFSFYHITTWWQMQLRIKSSRCALQKFLLKK